MTLCNSINRLNQKRVGKLLENRFSETGQQPTAGEPRLHDLVVLIQNDSQERAGQEPSVWACTYRIFEIWPENFRATCRALHGYDWLSDEICPLVLSHFSLSNDQIHELPGYVPWRMIAGTLEDELQGLRQILVDPIHPMAVPCIDFVDYVSVLGNGGEIRIWHASGMTATDATMGIVRQSNEEKSIWSQTAACSLAIRSPRPIALEDLDSAICAIDSMLPEKSFVAPSFQVVLDEGADFRVSLLSVMIRSDQ